MTNTRPRSRNKPSRRERRQAGNVPARPTARPRDAAKVYDAPAAAPPSAAKVYTAAPSAARSYSRAATQRRSFIGEPAPVDYSGEYRMIKSDLRRTFVWASVLIIAMIVLAFLQVF